MKIGKRTFIKLFGSAAVAFLPGIRLCAAKEYNKVLRGAAPRFYPGRIKALNIEKITKKGDLQG